MGYLTEQIADEVGRLTQERGRQYFHRGAVKSIDGDHSSVHAVVQGTIRYDVEITSNSGSFLAPMAESLQAHLGGVSRGGTAGLSSRPGKF